MTDPFIAMRQLTKRIHELGHELELDLEGVSFTPDPEYDDANFVMIVYAVTPDAVKTADEIEADTLKNEFDSLVNSSFDYSQTDEDGNPVLIEGTTETDPLKKRLKEMRERNLADAKERIERLFGDSDTDDDDVND